MRAPRKFELFFSPAPSPNFLTDSSGSSRQPSWSLFDRGHDDDARHFSDRAVIELLSTVKAQSLFLLGTYAMELFCTQAGLYYDILIFSHLKALEATLCSLNVNHFNNICLFMV